MNLKILIGAVEYIYAHLIARRTYGGAVAKKEKINRDAKFKSMNFK